MPSYTDEERKIVLEALHEWANTFASGSEAKQTSWSAIGKILDEQIDGFAYEVAARLEEEGFSTTKPEAVGEWRWSETNRAARFMVDTEDGNVVHVVVGVFADGSAAYKPFSSANMSEIDMYENLCGQCRKEMPGKTLLDQLVEDIKDDLKTIDEYARSWAPDYN